MRSFRLKNKKHYSRRQNSFVHRFNLERSLRWKDVAQAAERHLTESNFPLFQFIYLNFSYVTLGRRYFRRLAFHHREVAHSTIPNYSICVLIYVCFKIAIARMYQKGGIVRSKLLFVVLYILIGDQSPDHFDSSNSTQNNFIFFLINFLTHRRHRAERN